MVSAAVRIELGRPSQVESGHCRKGVIASSNRPPSPPGAFSDEAGRCPSRGGGVVGKTILAADVMAEGCVDTHLGRR
jgi:hypothetical protein